MTQTLPTSTPRDDVGAPQPARLTFGEMLEAVIDLSTGLVITLLPALVLAAPGIVLFVLLPAILLLALAAPLIVVGTVIALPPYALARWLRGRRQRTASPPVRPPDAVSQRGRSRALHLGPR
jgi:hypothetical protein